MIEDSHTELIVLPSLAARLLPDGKIVLTKKYLSGIEAYAKSWPGKVTSLVKLDSRPSTEMDQVALTPGELALSVEIRPADPKQLSERLKNAALVFAGLTGDELIVAKICRGLGVPLVFNSEYTLHTQNQIIDSQTNNLLLRVRRKIWARRNHSRCMKALSLATGLQCSGTPTYREYADQKAGTLLFFDNRVSETEILSPISLEHKLKKMETTADMPLRLLFGGRLVHMKGVLELPKVALELARRGLNFNLDIVGSGPLEEQLKTSIKHAALCDRVRLKPPLDFQTEWLPYVREHSDLFVCCHLQGDPSSTYPEVMSCGVPIVGYQNEALDGIVELSKGGITTPSSYIDLAKTILDLNNPSKLRQLATNARTFASEHTFERTFRKRVKHMVASSRLSPTVKDEWQTTENC